MGQDLTLGPPRSSGQSAGEHAGCDKLKLREVSHLKVCGAVRWVGEAWVASRAAHQPPRDVNVSSERFDCQIPYTGRQLQTWAPEAKEGSLLYFAINIWSGNSFEDKELELRSKAHPSLSLGW